MSRYLFMALCSLVLSSGIVLAQDVDVSAPSEGVLSQPVAPVEANAPIRNQADDNLFYDSEALVPSSEMSVKGGPRRANPRLEPASKFVVVKKNYGKDSKASQLVAAERALSLGRYSAALDLYDRLYGQNKRDPNILLGRASALQHVGRTEEAVLAYQELLDIKPQNLEAQLNMLGLMAKRYPAVALERLGALYNQSPGHAGIAAQIAVVSSEMGRHEDALKYLGIAAGIEPNSAPHVFNMAVILDRYGQKDDAVKHYEQALELDNLYGGGRTIPRDAVFERLAQLR